MRMLRAGIILMTYALIYVIIIAAVSRLLLIGGLGLLSRKAPAWQAFAGRSPWDRLRDRLGNRLRNSRRGRYRIAFGIAEGIATESP